MSAKNQFNVDLGNVKLTDKQRAAINIAIHKAVAGELANITTLRRLAVLPGNVFPYGIIVRPIDDILFENIKGIK